MLFTDGKLRAFEQMMRQPPRRPLRPNGNPKKSLQSDPALQPKPTRKEKPHGLD
ncbi:hypothetical protein SAMN04487895_11735 [Paenibacillus sophorae]|nr:hypothetical protein SAMN04487895_11735 [Paenibacillus sophorae]